MNISSMSSTQSLWKMQMNVSSQTQPSQAPAKGKGADAAKATEELLSLLGQSQNAGSTSASDTSTSASESTGAAQNGHQRPPALDLMNGRISIGLSGMSGAEESGSSAPKEFSKEDLTNLKQAIEKKGQAVSDGLSKLINDFETTDTDQNGKVSKQEVAAFAEKNGFSLPPAAQAGGSSNSESATGDGGFPGFSKEDLNAIKESVEKGMQAISQALQGMLDSFSKTDANQSGGLDLQELQSMMGNDETSTASGSQDSQPVIEIRFRPQQGGEKGLSKDDLEALKKTLEDNGIEVPEELDKLIESFDDVDQNKDGTLGKDEMKAFQETGKTDATAASNASDSTSSAASGALSGASAGDESSASQSTNFNRLLSQQMSKAYSYSASVRYESFQASYQTDMVA